MKSGYFFQIEQTSRPDKGIVNYRYNQVSRGETKGTDSDFPIYLNIRKDTITFYIQSRNLENSIYSNGEFLHLPLSSNLRSRDNLKNIIIGLYDEKLCFSENYKIEKIAKDRSYSGLKKTFKLDDFKDQFKNKKDSDSDIKDFRKCKKDKHPQAFPIRRLLLDFLFDLEHSEVFKTHPSYEKMEESLRNDLFMQALCAKADYYYKYTLLHRKRESDRNSQLIPDEDTIDQLYKNYILAQKQWLNIICNNIENSSIKETSFWFEEIETEHKRLYFKNLKGRIDLLVRERVKELNRENIKSQMKNSIIWFLKRYNLPFIFSIIFRLYFPIFKFDNRFKNFEGVGIVKFISSVLVFICIFIILPIAILKHNPQWFLNLPLAVFVFILFLILWAHWRLKGYKPFGILLPRIFMAIISGWFILGSADEAWRSYFDIHICDALLVGIVVGLITFLFTLWEIHNIAGRTHYRRVIVVLIIGIVYSTLTGIIYMDHTAKNMLVRTGNLSEYFVDFYKFDSLSFDQKKKWYVKLNNKEDTSKTSDSLIYVFFDDFEKNIQTYNKYRLFDCLEETIVQKPRYHFLNSIRNDGAVSKIEHWLDFENEKIMHKIHFMGRPVYIIPGMLIVNVFLSLFVGIFLNLIFQDKAITEPL